MRRTEMKSKHFRTFIGQLKVRDANGGRVWSKTGTITQTSRDTYSFKQYIKGYGWVTNLLKITDKCNIKIVQE